MLIEGTNCNLLERGVLIDETKCDPGVIRGNELCNSRVRIRLNNHINVIFQYQN